MRRALALPAFAAAALSLAVLSPLPALAADPSTEALIKAAAAAGVGVAPPAASPAAAPASAVKAEAIAVAAPALEPTPGTAAVAETPRPKPLPPSLVARINLSTQRMEVAVNGQTKHSWAISSGRSGYASPRGSFRVQWTAKMWYSRKYDMAPMPHAVFFKDGVAVHATTAVGMLGRPASHGCIRLAPANAALFYALVHKHGVQSTQIQVFGTSPADQVASRRAPGEQARERVAARAPLPAAQRPLRSASTASYFPPGSPYYGRPAYVHNGVLYVKMR